MPIELAGNSGLEVGAGQAGPTVPTTLFVNPDNASNPSNANVVAVQTPPAGSGTTPTAGRAPSSTELASSRDPRAVVTSVGSDGTTTNVISNPNFDRNLPLP